MDRSSYEAEIPSAGDTIIYFNGNFPDLLIFGFSVRFLMAFAGCNIPRLFLVL